MTSTTPAEGGRYVRRNGKLQRVDENAPAAPAVEPATATPKSEPESPAEAPAQTKKGK